MQDKTSSFLCHRCESTYLYAVRLNICSPCILSIPYSPRMSSKFFFAMTNTYLFRTIFPLFHSQIILAQPQIININIIPTIIRSCKTFYKLNHFCLISQTKNPLFKCLSKIDTHNIIIIRFPN